MSLRATWALTAILAVVGVIGLVALIAGGSCGCANSNYVCAVQPCPGSDLLWIACVVIGMIGGSFALTAAMLMRHNQRLRAYQAAQPPVTAEVYPTPLPSVPPRVSRPTAGEPFPPRTPRP